MRQSRISWIFSPLFSERSMMLEFNSCLIKRRIDIFLIWWIPFSFILFSLFFPSSLTLLRGFYERFNSSIFVRLSTNYKQVPSMLFPAKSNYFKFYNFSISSWSISSSVSWECFSLRTFRWVKGRMMGGEFAKEQIFFSTSYSKLLTFSTNFLRC